VINTDLNKVVKGKDVIVTVPDFNKIESYITLWIKGNLKFPQWIISGCHAAITTEPDGEMATTPTTVTAIKVDFHENEFS